MALLQVDLDKTLDYLASEREELKWQTCLVVKSLGSPLGKEAASKYSSVVVRKELS